MEDGKVDTVEVLLHILFVEMGIPGGGAEGEWLTDYAVQKRIGCFLKMDRHAERKL